MGTRGPTESSDIQQKIVMMAIREGVVKFGMVKQMWGGCAQEVSAFSETRERDFMKKHIKVSSSHHTPPPAEHLVPDLL